MTRLKTRVKMIAATAIVSATAAVGGVVTSGNFEAKAEDGNYVSFGDSIPSNPTQIQLSAQANEQLRSQLNIPELAPGHCALGKDNFPNRIAHDTGIETNNYACAASPAAAEHPHNFRSQVDTAIHEGKLNNKTRLVSVILGSMTFIRTATYRLKSTRLCSLTLLQTRLTGFAKRLPTPEL